MVNTANSAACTARLSGTSSVINAVAAAAPAGHNSQPDPLATSAASSSPPTANHSAQADC